MQNQRYLVTARKYRPQVFGDLVAQDHVTETLKNAIRLDRLAHAYLFSGPRGVGKTTAARILAKAINCTAPVEERPDYTEPCRQCDSCRSFEEGRNLNIIEIDAASNNKVEDIRELRDTVRIPPQGNRKKVYIIDEVHMLSNAAFNALLKTLEEPPPYVLFIFATTEPNKVLPTILSRCQRFDFRRIGIPEITRRLAEICQEEDLTSDDASLLLIARKGDGSLRDALSAFDQAVSLCGANLRYAELTQALGAVDIDLFFEVTRSVAASDSAGMLRLVERIMRAGYDLQEFLVGLAEHLRNLLVAGTMPDTSLIEATESTRERYAETSKQFSEADLLRLLLITAETEDAIKGSTQPRLKLEMAMLKMANLARTVDLREALRKLDHLESLARENRLPSEKPSGRTSVSQEASPSGAAALRPVTAPYRVQEPSASYSPPLLNEKMSEAVSEADERSQHPVAPAPETAGPPPVVHVSDDEDDGAERRQSDDEVRSGPSIPSSPAPVRKPESASESSPAPAVFPGLFGPPALARKKPPQNALNPEAENVSPAAGATSPRTQAPVAVETARPLRPALPVWPNYVQTVMAERIHVGALLKHGNPVEIQNDTLTVTVPDDFHQRLLDSQSDFLLKHLAKFTQAPVTRLRFTVCQDQSLPDPAETSREIDPVEYMKNKRQDNPVIRAIFDEFGGELVW